MDNQVPIHQIIRNLASGGKEYADEIRDWLNTADGNQDIYQEIRDIWQLTGTFPDRFSPNRAVAWQKVRKQIYLRKKNHFGSRQFAGIAASIVLAFLCFWAGTRIDSWKDPGYSEIISPAGQKTRLILPDSSSVLLNGDSRIRYSHDFNQRDRDIELQGEAYFDVREDRSKPFIVRTDNLKIKVYGTSFDVKAYGDDQAVEVGLKTGQVGVEHGEKEIARLLPGQMAVFNKEERTVAIREMDMEIISAWTRDELVFEENSLTEIVKCMERWYGVHMEVAPELFDGERFTFKVKTESLRELLELINLIKPVQYRIEGKQVVLTQP